ncbi:MAG: hypothetical protein KGJ84_03975 [Elusimicrobia bacterium]|nr:hypothetical protein [Elusimicrobiota bacterium]
MKLSLLLLFVALTLTASRARAGDEAVKASSGLKFLETGGSTSVADGADAVKGGAGSGRALHFVNGAETKTILDGEDVPGPGHHAGDALVRGVRTAQGALYGAVAGAVIGGGVGLFGGPAGVFGGAAGGAQLGAMAGMALGAGLCFLLGGKAGSGKPGAIEKSQNDLDDALKQL